MKNINIIDKFNEFSNESFDGDNEFIYQKLNTSKEGYLKDKLKMIKRLKLKFQAQINKTTNENLFEMAVEKLQSLMRSSNENMKESLEKLIQKRSTQFQFGNIEQLDKEVLKELLGELTVIEIIEDLEKRRHYPIKCVSSN